MIDDLEKYFNDTPLWLSSRFQEVNWDNILKKTAPFLDEEQRELVIDRAGYKSVNPLLIITDLLLNHMKNSSFSLTSFKEFKEKIKKRIDEMSDSFQELENKNIAQRGFTESIRNKVSAIKKLVGDKSDRMKSFLGKYKELFIEHVRSDLKPIVEFSKESPGNFSMTWPWAKEDSWRVGGTHYTTKGIPSALDVSLSTWHCRK